MTNDVDQILAPVPVLDEKMQAALRFDLVSRIQSYETIGGRYGLGGEKGLAAYLVANPAFRQEVAKMRAMFSSEMSTQERARLKALLASEEAIVDIFGIATNQANTPATRIDAFKQLNRMGGVDGLPPASKDGGGGSGTQFSLTINMPDGRQEKIIAAVIDQPVTDPPSDE